MSLTLPLVTHIYKREITHRNVTRRNIAAMAKYVADDELREGWRNLLHPWERLKWARRYWQYQAGAVNGTATDAAESLGIKPGTYRTYERAAGSSKSTPLDHQMAIEFGRKFRVSWTWILLNHGTPFDGALAPAQEKVVKLMAEIDEEQQNFIADMVQSYFESQKKRSA